MNDVYMTYFWQTDNLTPLLLQHRYVVFWWHLLGFYLGKHIRRSHKITFFGVAYTLPCFIFVADSLLFVELISLSQIHHIRELLYEMYQLDTVFPSPALKAIICRMD